MTTSIRTPDKEVRGTGTEKARSTRLPRLPRLPRIGRVQEERQPRFRLTERDRDIILAVHDCRVLTTNHLEALFFPAGERQEGQEPSAPKSPYNSRCRLRLQALYHARYLQRDEQPQKLNEGRKPLVYTLDTKGAELVAEIYDIPVAELRRHTQAFRISPFTLGHLLATNDVRVAVQVGARRHGVEIVKWLDDYTLRQRTTTDYVILRTREGGKQKVSLVPDGYFLFETEAHRYHQFLEIDMGTTTGMYAKYGRRDWARKVQTYLEYYRSGKYQAQYGTRSMRVLTVTTSEKRLANLKALIERAGGRGRFWLTTFEHARNSDVLTDPIWCKAGSSDLYALI